MKKSGGTSPMSGWCWEWEDHVFFLGKGYPYDSSKTRRLRFWTNLSSDDVRHVQLEPKCKRIQPAEFVWWGNPLNSLWNCHFLYGIPLMEKNTISRHTSHESREIKTLKPMILRVSSTNLWLSVNLLTQVQTIAMSFLVSFPAPLFSVSKWLSFEKSSRVNVWWAPAKKDKWLVSKCFKKGFHPFYWIWKWGEKHPQLRSSNHRVIMWRLTSCSRFRVPYYQTHPFLNSGMMYRCSFQTPAIPSLCQLLVTRPFLLQSSSQCQRMCGKSNAIRHASSTHGGLKTSCNLRIYCILIPILCWASTSST